MEAVRPKQKRKTKEGLSKRSTTTGKNEKSKKSIDESASSTHQHDTSQNLATSEVRQHESEASTRATELTNKEELVPEETSRVVGLKVSEVDEDLFKICGEVISATAPLSVVEVESFKEQRVDVDLDKPKSTPLTFIQPVHCESLKEDTDDEDLFEAAKRSLGVTTLLSVESAPLIEVVNHEDLFKAAEVCQAAEVAAGAEQAIKDGASEERALEIEVPSCPELSAVSDLPVLSTPLYPVSQVKGDERKIKSKTGHRAIPRIYPSLQEITKEFESIQPFSEDQLLQLYRNSYLEANEVFIDNFIQYEKNPENHPFHELIRTYLRSRTNLSSSHFESNDLQKQAKQREGNLWKLIPDIVTQSGKCLDGQTVSGFHKFTRAKFNDEALSILSQTLQQLREHVQDAFTLHIYTAELSRLQIESYIQTLLFSPALREIPRNAPVASLLPNERSPQLYESVRILRQCISILFSFHRRVVSDRKFVTDVRDWLTKLVAMLLRVAILEDHLFLLNHVLRCPAGVANWAASFIQPPTPVPWSDSATQLASFGSAFLDHALVTLSTLLLPVKAREEFLEHIKATLSSSFPSPNQLSENLWVLVDSEGEEDEDPSKTWLHWQENDVVAVLNQVPVSAVFGHILLISNRQGSGAYSSERTTEQRMLKVLAFSTRLMKLFQEGLKTYCALRYKQLAKRISRLIRHTVQYVSDHWQDFRQCHTNAQNSAFMLRLQVEYDQFFLRAVNCIFSSQKLGAWQFMAVLPYKCVSTQMMWRLLWVLHNSYQENQELCSYQEKDWEMKLQDKTVKLLFEEKLSALPESEAFYLLTAFANMASARDETDMRFISAVTVEVFEIAFVNTKLREMLSKDGRDLLVSISTKHPFIISVLLKQVKEDIEKIGLVSLFLFRELPVHSWHPAQEDIDVLSECLLTCPLSSPANQLARLILSELNWDFDSKGTELFLDLEIHRQVALLVIEGFRKFTNASDASLLSRSIQQVFLLAQSMRASAATAITPQGFVTWAWDLLLCLRLHSLHGPHPPWVNILSAMPNEEEGLPDLHNDTQLHLLLQAVKQQQPAACYVALVMTSIGHSTESLCRQGFDLWSELIGKEMYAAATHALFVLLPFFYRDPYPLITNERFLTDIQYVILADLTYTALAKSLVVSEFPGQGLQQLTGMMLSQIQQAKIYATEVGGQAARLWCILLVKMLDISQQKGYISKWKGVDHILYMLDQLVQFTCVDTYLLETIFLALSRLVKASPSTSGSTMVSSILSLVSSSFAQGWPSLAPQTILPTFSWYFWCALSVETENHQMESLWNALQLELMRDAMLTPENALKKVGTNLKLAPPKVENLPLHRCSAQALEMPISHPCLPLVWQKFFFLYLQRINSLPGLDVKGSIGYKFFSSDAKLALLKRMKRRLNQTADHHYQLLQECTTAIGFQEQALAGLIDDNDEFALNETTELLCKLKCEEQHHAKLMRLFRSLSLWIEEPRLHDADLRLLDLPPQYDPEKLKAIVEGDKRPWFEYVEMEKVKQELFNLTKVWLQQRKPAKIIVESKPQEDATPAARILKRLGTYEEPLPPPALSLIEQVVPEVPLDLSRSIDLFTSSVQNCLRTVCDQARVFSQRTSKHLGLDCEYLELLPALYRNDVAQLPMTLACNRHMEDGKPCLGPATIVLTFREAHKIETVNGKIERNRTAYNILLSEFMQAPPQNVCSSAVYVENCITALVNQQRTGDGGSLRDVGVKMFYHIMSLMDRHTNQYSPTRQFLTCCLDVLGEEFIHGEESQCLPLIKIMINQPTLAGLVAPLFTPSQVSNDTYLELYEYLVSNLCPGTSNTIFVLLSKFDLCKWLSASKPPLSNRTRLIEAVGQALCMLGMEPEEEMMVLQDVFRNHLQVLLLYQFPQHYGDTLHLLLKGTGSESISLKVWNDFLQSLSPHSRPQDPHANPEQSKAWLRQYCSSHTVVSEKALEETLQTVHQYFEQQRFSSKDVENSGLYYKFGAYTEPLGYFLGMTVHAWIFCNMHHGTDAPSESLCRKLWQKIREVFGHWVEPWMKGERHMVPFLEQDFQHASWMFFIYVSCLEYLHECFTGLPANCVLQLTFRNYIKTYCSEIMKDYILTMCLNKFSPLPWETFTPDMNDMQLMLEALQKKKEDATAFTGHLFTHISWECTLQHAATTESAPTIVKYLINFATLAIQLAWEPNVQMTGTLSQILRKAESFSWFMVGANEVEALFHLAVQKCDPTKVLLQYAEKGTESCIFRLLRSLTGMNPVNPSDPKPPTHQDLLQKRLIYTGSFVQLVIAASSVPNNISKHKSEFQVVLPHLLELCEVLITADVPLPVQLEVAVNLLCHVFKLMGQSAPTELQELAVRSLLVWLQAHINSMLVLPCITAACRTVSFVHHLTSVVETCIGTFCISGANLTPYGGWSHIVPMLQIPETRQEDFLLGCVETSSHLTQHAFLLQQLPQCPSLVHELAFLHRIVDWFAKIKPCEMSEPKAILLWDKVIDLSLRQVDFGGDIKAIERALGSFSTTLMAFSEDKIYLGFLGVIGLGNSSPFSVRFRLMCRTLATFLLLQLPMNGKLRLQPNSPGHVRSMSGGVGKPSQQTLQAVGKLEGLRSSKHYLPILQAAESLWNFVMDPNKCLRDGHALFQEFVATFYPNTAYLRILYTSIPTNQANL